MEKKHNKNIEDCPCEKCRMNRWLLTITNTTEGYEVKNLIWKPIDSIITGLVKCPIMGRIDRHEGFVSFQWRTNGKPFKMQDRSRIDLTLNIPRHERS